MYSSNDMQQYPFGDLGSYRLSITHLFLFGFFLDSSWILDDFGVFGGGERVSVFMLGGGGGNLYPLKLIK